MENYLNGSKAQNEINNIFYKSISSQESETNLDNNYYIINHNTRLRTSQKNINTEETNKDYRNYFNKNGKNYVNFIPQDLNDEATINQNDINYTKDNKSNKSQTISNFYRNSKIYNKPNNILENYIIRLKNFGFPEIGEIYLSPDAHEQEKTFNFFDYIIAKETNNLEKNNIKAKEYEDYKGKYKELQYTIINLKGELNNNIQLSKKMKEDLEFKIKKQKDMYEQKLSLLNKNNEYLTYVNNKIYFKKKNLELKLYSMNQTINKFEDMKSNIINAVEAIDNAQSNDMAKMLTRVKGAEKLIETLKGGYNESLRELSLKVSSLKNLIYEIHNEISILLENPRTIEKNDNDMSFYDTIEYYKKIFKHNIRSLKDKMQMIDISTRQDSIP